MYQNFCATDLEVMLGEGNQRKQICLNQVVADEKKLRHFCDVPPSLNGTEISRGTLGASN